MNGFLFLLESILNGVTPKTSNSHPNTASGSRETKIVEELPPFSCWRGRSLQAALKNESSVVNVELHKGITSNRDIGLPYIKGGEASLNQDVTIVTYITLIYVLQSQRIKQLFSCKIFHVNVQTVVILFEVDVRLQKKNS